MNDYNQSGGSDTEFDYYSPERSPWKKIVIIIILAVAVLSVVGYLIFSKGHYFWDREVVPVVTSIPKATPKDTTQILQPEPATFNTDVSTNVTSGNKYHIIAGAFIVEKNADNFMDELHSKGYQPQIVLERNNYRFVGIFSFPTFKEANEKYKSLQSDGIPIWIMKY